MSARSQRTVCGLWVCLVCVTLSAKQILITGQELNMSLRLISPLGYFVPDSNHDLILSRIQFVPELLH